ncbi:hypothetical protein JB92DRAFT_3145108 [Gautieria morchelliformis]|nr:hypothetical protein JB92DRAFT_3145108 [Gautieria morchelliformis]
MATEAPPSFAASVGESEASQPPRYEDDGHRLEISSPQLTERVYTLETGENRPWAFLKVKSRGTKPTSISRFFQGEPITGTVELSLEKTDHIRAVTVEVQGESLAVGQEPFRFLTKKINLWSTSMGDPRTGNAGIGSPKLKGDYVWPFSIALPDTVATSAVEKEPLSIYQLPPISERASPCYLEYKVIATFHRGRLRIDHSLSTTIVYLPRSRPSAPSVLRQLAYREHTALLGPEVDPEGWEILGTKSVTGTVFESRKVEVACLFALAKPLCYTRGTSIPFRLTLSCSDRQALDLFAGRGSLSIRLERVLRTGQGATDEAKATRTDNVFVINVGKGIYWPSEDDNTSNTSETRKLVGEIPVAVELKPSFVFPRITMRYRVTLALIAPGFDSENSGAFSREVEIATVLAPGPIPRSMVPATHRDEEAGNYDVTIGMLTGANQRAATHLLGLKEINVPNEKARKQFTQNAIVDGVGSC